MTGVLEAARPERLALVELLETLTAAEWATPSLCRGWTVQEVAAHLAWAPALSLRQELAEVVRAGFRQNRMIADTALRWSRRGPEAIVSQLRRNALADARPPLVPAVAVVVDAVVHALDIRRPLGRSRPIDPAAFRIAAEFCAGAGWPSSTMLGGRPGRRIRGLRLVAEDQDWSFGEGQEVRAPGEVIVLALSGRPVDREELSGPGAATLHARL